MGVASIRDYQSAQSAISLMQASIQSTIETSFTAMTAQIDKMSYILMNNARDARMEREEDQKSTSGGSKIPDTKDGG